MQTSCTPMDQIPLDATARFGGKTCSLATLARSGVRVPRFVGLDIQAYRQFVRENELDRSIAGLLGRKPLEGMRWEEVWDLALTLRNLFLRTGSSPFLEGLAAEIAGHFPSRALLAVRSSAPGEDAGATSFAGLHESHVGLPGGPEGTAAVADALVRVWSSLWSDRALLYRRELGLDVDTSAMAVLVQECIQGDCSGVAFCTDPTDETRTVIEAVPGMNQALVDGSLSPARWLLDRESGRVLDVQPGPWEPGRDRLPEAGEIQRVWELSRRCERHFLRPQDVEWTIRGSELFCLQSRPITTNLAQGTAGPGEDRRPWYLSLHRSFENLTALRREVEEDLLPALDRESAALARIDLNSLDHGQLAGEIDRRRAAMARWRDVYWAMFIPLAAAIVESRGGMLVHGAIIAREYGLPCVTGVREALDAIRSGDRLLVDGFKGMVTIQFKGPVA